MEVRNNITIEEDLHTITQLNKQIYKKEQLECISRYILLLNIPYTL